VRHRLINITNCTFADKSRRRATDRLSKSTTRWPGSGEGVDATGFSMDELVSAPDDVLTRPAGGSCCVSRPEAGYRFTIIEGRVIQEDGVTPAIVEGRSCLPEGGSASRQSVRDREPRVKRKHSRTSRMKRSGCSKAAK
jgi:hypothetical protein